MQSRYNYRYDELGNLNHDEQEEIETITWTASGKLKKIIRKSTSTNPDMEFHYDVSGNRLRKVIKPHGSSVENGGVDDPTLWIASDYSRDPQGNVMAIYESKFENSAHEYNLKERNIYGSARLGVDLNEVDMYLTPQSIISQSNDPQLKKYELSNHLGNVVATVNNYKIAVPDISGTLIDHYASDVANTSDYYPFGSLLKERTCRWVWMKGANYLNDPTDVELAFVNMNEPPAGIAIEGKSYRLIFKGKAELLFNIS